MSRFIVFEGIDGSGKSTQIEKLAASLEQLCISTRITREPTDGAMGRLLRSYLKKEQHITPDAIALLFAADRLDHINGADGIKQALDQGKWVICDRYYLSSYAYHSVDCDLEWVMDINRMAAQTAKPDLHIFIDLPPEVAMDRVKKRGETELFEQLERQKQTRDCFFKVFERVKGEENIVIVDGTKDPDSLAADVFKIISGMIK